MAVLGFVRNNYATFWEVIAYEISFDNFVRGFAKYL